jgi:hypothetical protein
MSLSHHVALNLHRGLAQPARDTDPARLLEPILSNAGFDLHFQMRIDSSNSSLSSTNSDPHPRADDRTIQNTPKDQHDLMPQPR